MEELAFRACAELVEGPASELPLTARGFRSAGGSDVWKNLSASRFWWQSWPLGQRLNRSRNPKFQPRNAARNPPTIMLCHVERARPALGRASRNTPIQPTPLSIQ